MSGAPPRARVPADARTVSVFCAGCRTRLLRYRKGGDGGLVKIRRERIAEDFTAGDLRCPRCGQTFARERGTGGGPAFLIGGKVFTRGLRRR